MAKVPTTLEQTAPQATAFERPSGALDRRDVPATRERQALLAVDRAVGDWRRGRPVVLADGHGTGVIVLSAEHHEPQRLAELRDMVDGPFEIAITARRAAALGLPAPKSEVIVVDLGAVPDPDFITRLADPVAGTGPVSERLSWRNADPHDNASAAIALAKIARLLPAAIIMAIDEAGDLAHWAGRRDLMFIDAGDIFRYEIDSARSLRPVSEARIPLAAAANARVHAFRPADGAVEHLAIIIGDPQPDAPVLTRVHSECFTGDLLGSLRCDCGDQLQGAISEIAAAGSGILLYLAQEGRGIGLVNKLRAYELQDQGFDTIDANEQLGFDADERVYLPAAQMLRLLGFGAVRLLTNNPEKVRALTKCGISVVERVPHAFPANQHNETYLRTKAQRAGHLF